VDLCGSTAAIAGMGAEDAGRTLNTELDLICEELGRFGGTVVRRMGDGAMASFGAPVPAEDHAVRACLAAQAVLEAFRASNGRRMPVRLGIASGEVLVRSLRPDLADFDAIGVTAALAARLEQAAAPGSALLSAQTARAVAGLARVEPRGPVELKGFPAPVPVFALVSVAERPSWAVRSSVRPLSDFVGRADEMAALAAALERARAGRPQAVALVADGGTGKSRLVHEFLRRLPDGGWRLLQVATTTRSPAISFFAVTALLRGFAGCSDQDPAAEVAARLRGSVAAAAAADLAPLLAHLDCDPGEPEWRALAPGLQRRRLVGAVRQLLRWQARDEPLVLLIEDYHWLDESSIGLLREATSDLGPVPLLQLVTTRPEVRPGWRTGDPDAQEIALLPLAPDHADSMLRQLIGDASGTAALRQRIVARAGGTPFFIEEIARSLLDAGAIADSPRDLADIDVPASVQAILAARMDRLPQGQRRILQVAAVVGTDARLPLLAEVAGRDQRTAGEEAAALRANGFLVELCLASGVAYGFAHALTQAVAYDSMLRTERRRLHGSVLRWLERDPQGEEDVEQLAHHAVRADAGLPAARYAMAAGERAARRSGWKEAVLFLEAAVDALDRLDPSPDIVRMGIEARLRLRNCLIGLADDTKVKAVLDQAGRLAEQSGDEGVIAQVFISRGTMLAQWGEVGTAISVSRTALGIMRARADSAGTVAAAFALGQALAYAGGFREAEQVLTGTLAYARNEGVLKRAAGTTVLPLAVYFCCFAAVHEAMGDTAAGFASVAEAKRRTDGARRPFDQVVISVYEASLLLADQRVEAAIEMLERARALALAKEMPQHGPRIARVLGRAYLAAGQHARARAVLEDASSYADNRGLTGMRLLCAPPLVRAVAEGPGGDLAHARVLAERTLRDAAAHGMRPTTVGTLTALGRIMAATGDTSAAAATLREAAALAQSIGFVPGEADARRELADLGPDFAARGEAVRIAG
jgi:tetratricopeptide (TPR) repeat protein